MNAGVLLGAAVLLGLERITYAWIWSEPDAFRTAYAGTVVARLGGPLDVVQFLFMGFKVLQAVVFVAWCYIYGDGSLWPPDGGAFSLGLGGTLVLAGQFLSVSVFYRLGKVGVFYGNRFGYHVAECRKFPFSVLEHPQYLGSLMTIWGIFLVMRFPHGDWYQLPVLETIYYALGARFERYPRNLQQRRTEVEP